MHRWDAENALGAARPVPEVVAANAVTQTFEVMAPARRAWMKAPPGAANVSALFGPTGRARGLVRFDGEDVRLGFGEDGASMSNCPVRRRT